MSLKNWGEIIAALAILWLENSFVKTAPLMLSTAIYTKVVAHSVTTHHFPAHIVDSQRYMHPIFLYGRNRGVRFV
jgi:hypothetical protein